MIIQNRTLEYVELIASDTPADIASIKNEQIMDTNTLIFEIKI